MRKFQSGRRKTETQKPEPVRQGYDEHGPEQYYALHESNYRNPHEPAIRKLLEFWVGQAIVPSDSKVLDLACGSGEVSLMLQELGICNTIGIDPYTAPAYELRTNKSARKLSFEEIALNGLNDDSGKPESFDFIICSFAMHLCDRSRLPVLCLRLAESSQNLVIITPHKRPEIEPAWGWELISEIKMDRVRLRHYVNLK